MFFLFLELLIKLILKIIKLISMSLFHDIDGIIEIDKFFRELIILIL